MSLCGAPSCGSAKAELKCDRCQGVFYCNGDCQRIDWKRHKRFCKQLPNPSASSVAAPRQLRLRLGPKAASQADVDLIVAVDSFHTRVNDSPSSFASELESALKVVKALLARGARPDALVKCLATDETGWASNCQCLAVTVGACTAHPAAEPLLELLLAAKRTPALGVDAAYESDRGVLYTALYSAIITLRAQFVRLLIAHGADVKAPCSQLASGRLDWPVQMCVSSTQIVVAANGRVEGALEVGGIADRTLETLGCLIAAKADVDAVDAGVGDEAIPTPLIEALAFEHKGTADRAIMDAVAMRLINAGANVHARDRQQWRALDIASTLPSLDIFKALLAKGADPSPVSFIGRCGPGDAEGVTAGAHYLQIAAQNGRDDVLRAAAAAGVNLKKVKVLSRSAFPLLMHSLMMGQLSCVRYLLEYGVDVNEVFREAPHETTALDFASSARGTDENREQITQALLAAGGKRAEEL